ncbi:MAG: phage terminase large subunit family protein [Oscillospiraceae bacterium]|jgi:hypothetical protein|nr:phage terminase large subunit family protein [Oscillospiraceae bacterium]
MKSVKNSQIVIGIVLCLAVVLGILGIAGESVGLAVVAAILMIICAVFYWATNRCPKCGGLLSARYTDPDNAHCPHCGIDLNALDDDPETVNFDDESPADENDDEGE